jgi:acetyl-CoA carboxylase carboxyl transferase subunit alpha
MSGKTSRRSTTNNGAKRFNVAAVRRDMLVTEAADGSIDTVEIVAPNADEATQRTWQRVQIARHPERPKTLDYIKWLCPDFVELHGDRRFGDDAALIGGIAEFAGRTVMVMGHQKGKDTKENIHRNFGMPTPEGYRKAMRLMEQAEKFGFPLITFIDTPGAYPGLESEERSVAQAIAENLAILAQLRTSSIAVVIGEGGSGGALAIGLCDRVLMLENSIYSVASPEASASILWRDSAKASIAATTMKITAPDLLGYGLIDEVIAEPEGGAHADPSETGAIVKEVILRHLTELESKLDGGELSMDALLAERYEKYRRMGAWIESD